MVLVLVQINLIKLIFVEVLQSLDLVVFASYYVFIATIVLVNNRGEYKIKSIKAWFCL